MFNEVTASNKDETKPWGRFFVGLYDNKCGIAHDFWIPTSDDRIGNLKSKIVNQFWPGHKLQQRDHLAKEILKISQHGADGVHQKMPSGKDPNVVSSVRQDMCLLDLSEVGRSHSLCNQQSRQH